MTREDLCEKLGIDMDTLTELRHTLYDMIESHFWDEQYTICDWRKHTCGECGYWYNSDCSNFDRGTCRKNAWYFSTENEEGGYVERGTKACPDFTPREVNHE